MSNEDAKKLNPDITIVTYGKKELKELTIYPLSLGDQFKVTDMVSSIIQQLVDGQKANQTTDFVFMTSVVNALQKNINKILSFITDLPEKEVEKIVANLTNSQLVDLVDVIWSVNFEPALKKGKSLFERGRSVFSSKDLSPSSSSATPNTGSKMSTVKATKKEE